MVNSTANASLPAPAIYNSRNLYGQFDKRERSICSRIYNSRNLYGQFDAPGQLNPVHIYNSRNLYCQFDDLNTVPSVSYLQQ